MMWKSVVLEVVWVPDEVVAPSMVEKPVPPLELVLLCWGNSEVGDFHSEYMVAVVARVKNLRVVETCFCERCGKSD